MLGKSIPLKPVGLPVTTTLCPGSGKTTLTQALIHEICHEAQSQFRQDISSFYSERTTYSEIDGQSYLKKKEKEFYLLHLFYVTISKSWKTLRVLTNC